MDYPVVIGLGVAGLVLTKVAVDTVSGYVFTSRLLQDGLSHKEIEQRVEECMPFDMKYTSKIGRNLAYRSHRHRASRTQGQGNGVEQL